MYLLRPLSSSGNTVASGIGIHFNDPRGESQRMKLEATPTANKRQAMCWVAAIQKVTIQCCETSIVSDGVKQNAMLRLD